MTEQNTRPTPSSDVEELFPNCERWGALEWFNRLAKAVRSRDEAAVADDKSKVETFRNIASSSASRLVREFEDEVRAALSTPAQVEMSWRDDPAADERWNAGLDYAQEQLCIFLGVDPSQVTWDAATETLDGDVRAVIGNILRMKLGEDWGPNVVATPAQVEVTDELRSAAEQVLNYATLDDVLDDKGRHENDVFAIRLGDLCRLRAALTVTDAKPVPAEPVAEGEEHESTWTVTIIASGDDENTAKEAIHHGLAYAHRAGFISAWSDAAPAPPSPVEGEVERLSFDDLQTLIQVRDRRHSIIESSTDRLLQAFALSDRGLLALEQLPSGADLHITRKGRKAIDAALASEGKTDA